MIFRPAVPPDREMGAENPAVHRGATGWITVLTSAAIHFSGLVNRDPRREEPSPPIAWPSVRRSPPGSLRKAVSHQGEWRRAPAHTLARKNTSITDHNAGLLPPVQTGYGSRSPRDLNFKACPKKVSSSSNLSVIATTPRHACNWSTCRST